MIRSTRDWSSIDNNGAEASTVDRTFRVRVQATIAGELASRRWFRHCGYDDCKEADEYKFGNVNGNKDYSLWDVGLCGLETTGEVDVANVVTICHDICTSIGWSAGKTSVMLTRL